MDRFRPEYVESVHAALWNLWLAPLFLTAPVLPAIGYARRLSTASIIAAVFASIFCTWLSFFLHVEHYWEAKESYAVTAAERLDVAADTGRLFGPMLVGASFSIVYTLVWLCVLAIGRWSLRLVSERFSQRNLPTNPDETDYASYRASLVKEYQQLRDKKSRP